MITIIILGAVLFSAIVVAALRTSVFNLSNLGPISATEEINDETPKIKLDAELCRGDISRENYEMLMAKKFSLKVA